MALKDPENDYFSSLFFAIEIIFIPHNIILAEIGARLNLDEQGREFTRIAKAVFGPNGNIATLIFCHQEGFFSQRNFSRARNDDPVLGAVVVALQGKLCAWFYQEAFDLKAAAFIKTLIPAPGPIDTGVINVLDTFCFFQFFNNYFYILCPMFGGKQHSVFGRNRNHIIHTNQRQADAIKTVHIAVCSFEQ